MYFDIIKTVLDREIARYADENATTQNAVCDAIKAHIEKTSTEHYKDEPDIEYQDSLCRLGYLYVHTAANATLFQRTISSSKELTERIKKRSGDRLCICAVGGGPGTEMLGLVKFFAKCSYMPSRVDFIVLDGVPQWSESWMLLAREAETELAAQAKKRNCTAPPVAPMFLPMDVMRADSYKHHGYVFRQADVVVMNYLLSENKNRLNDFQNTLKFMIKSAESKAFFVFIDRKEYAKRSTFLSDVQSLIKKSGLAIVGEMDHGKNLDGDEQTSNLEHYLDKFKRLPRVKFWDNWQRRPTAFSIVCQKP